uniref:Uncharacterized protein n=1 Tax=Lactuca sativa TaxID=4236 RepID=A0A9R1WXF2_LACSA|nr:hypothetical protein LSAT_V11C800438090 [Lactuca sativa]
MLRVAYIPYRDSKLTRLPQSSLSGHGRLICTLEQEGEAKDALLNQIQSLTRLILFSTNSPHQTDPGSIYSFREEENISNSIDRRLLGTPLEKRSSWCNDRGMTSRETEKVVGDR